MLFSQPEVAEYLDRHFECAWESVRDVPRVFVDFGGGTTLERTLLGNIVTWFCFEDGTVFDAVPGIVDEVEYLSRLEAAVAAHGELRSAVDRHAAVLERHLRVSPQIVLSHATPPRSLSDLVKNDVEGDLKTALAPQPPPVVLLDLNEAFSKGMVEEPVRRSIESESSLERDTWHNKFVRYPQVSQFLARHPLPVKPADVYRKLFWEVLHVPLEDPFLGLAPDVIGGEGGRRVGGR